jgi:hypothetical protein
MTIRFSTSWLPDRFGGLATPRAVILVPRLSARNPLMESSVPPPSAPCLLDPEEIRYSVRAVTGEIVRDGRGRLFESVGGSLRPLHRLMTGARGELLEAEPIPARESSGPSEAPTDGDPAAPTWRRLLSEPGERRMVRFGDFKTQLLPQLAHPERLRDVHLLPCLVQIYEVTAGQRIDALVAAIGASTERRIVLQRLTAVAGRRLGLDRWVRAQAGAGSPARGWLAPGARLFRLTLEDDPTEAAARAQPPAVEARGLRTDIPAEQVRAWEFVRSREEVMGELAAAAALAHPLSGIWRWLRRIVGLRGALRAWLGRCTGRSADDQLWAVRPPKGALDHPRVRDWAAATLERAGYDPRRMLVEWEIFWRRKGV